jgi:hypothetical protein
MRRQIERLLCVLIAVLATGVVYGGVSSGRPMAFVFLLLLIPTWMASRAARYSEGVHFFLPIPLLIGSIFAGVGLLQELGYGRLIDEPVLPISAMRLSFFVLALVANMIAFGLCATVDDDHSHDRQ